MGFTLSIATLNRTCFLHFVKMAKNSVTNRKFIKKIHCWIETGLSGLYDKLIETGLSDVSMAN